MQNFNPAGSSSTPLSESSLIPEPKQPHELEKEKIADHDFKVQRYHHLLNNEMQRQQVEEKI